MVKFTPRPLYPRGRFPVPIDMEDGWATGAGLDIFGEEKFYVSAGIRTPDRPAPSESLNLFSCLVVDIFFFNFRLSARSCVQ
jgi:hypothetical protein